MRASWTIVYLWADDAIHKISLVLLREKSYESFMFQFSVLTLFPELIKAGVESGVLGQAQKKSLLEIQALNPREFTHDVHKTVDDRPFGGGDGMVMMYEPLKHAYESLRSKGTRGPLIYLSPQGALWSDQKARALATLPEQSAILLCGRYAGVDQRFVEECVDEEISIGDYILSGGELAALCLIDSVSRFVPGVLGNTNSSEKESLANGLLECPQITRPREMDGFQIPEVLIGGNHARIEDFRFDVSLVRTYFLRPDLWVKAGIGDAKLQGAIRRLRELSAVEMRTIGLKQEWFKS